MAQKKDFGVLSFVAPFGLTKAAKRLLVLTYGEQTAKWHFSTSCHHHPSIQLNPLVAP
jgi:hypothetical protein